jgi:hypothetical protein
MVPSRGIKATPTTNMTPSVELAFVVGFLVGTAVNLLTLWFLKHYR